MKCPDATVKMPVVKIHVRGDQTVNFMPIIQSVSRDLVNKIHDNGIPCSYGYQNEFMGDGFGYADYSVDGWMTALSHFVTMLSHIVAGFMEGSRNETHLRYTCVHVSGTDEPSRYGILARASPWHGLLHVRTNSVYGQGLTRIRRPANHRRVDPGDCFTPCDLVVTVNIEPGVGGILCGILTHLSPYYV